MADNFATNLRRLIRARFPLLSIRTAEESRAAGRDRRGGRQPHPGDARAAGLHLVDRERVRRARPARQPGHPHPARGADRGRRAAPRPSVVVLLDLHPWLGTNATPPDTQLVRALKDTVRYYKDGSVPRTLMLDLADPADPAGPGVAGHRSSTSRCPPRRSCGPPWTG